MPRHTGCSLQAPAASRAGLALRPDGQFLVADRYNHRVQLCPGGGAPCTTVAGGNGQGSSGASRPYIFDVERVSSSPFAGWDITRVRR